jgi:hypothetical protein
MSPENPSILPEGVETYLGVSFDLGAGTQYGWIGVVRNAAMLDAFAWGYETDPGVPIAAGAWPPCSSNADCDDGNACTADSCDPATGECANVPTDCDDGDPCTIDSCDPATGQCGHVPAACDDGDACTTDSCDPATGECGHVPAVCDDGYACTADSCDPATGECVFEDLCPAGEVCADGQCVPWNPATIDIRPGSCPNVLNRTSNSLLPVGLLGAADFDVSLVNLASLGLARADGVGGSVAPHEGPPGPHTIILDVGTPFEGQQCDCHHVRGDGIDDLALKFKTADLVAALGLDSLSPGALVELILSGELADGTPFSGSDCIRLVPPGSSPGRVAVGSTVPGAWIDVTPPDECLDEGGFAYFERSYPTGSVVTLVAEPTAQGLTFKRWEISAEGGFWARHVTGNRTVRITVDTLVNVNVVYESDVGWGTDGQRIRTQRR